MTKTRHMLASAPIAIAAMAALSTTPLAAQSADPAAAPPVQDTVPQSPPPIVLPEPQPTANPAPLVIPDFEPEVQGQSAAQPTSEPAARSSAQRPAQPRPATTAARTQPRTAVATTAPASESVAEAETATFTESADEPVAAAAAMPTVDSSQPVVSDFDTGPASDEGATNFALLALLLGLGGFGLIVFLLMRRRKRAQSVPEIERPIAAPAAAVAASPAPRTAAPLRERQDRALAGGTNAAGFAPSAFARSDGAAVELPRELPADFEQRDSLLRRMVQAKPDRANPFRSPKARAKRARLILQSIGQSFRDRKPRIDLSQYTNVWPELRGWKPANG
ncbi:MAG: hypothetical protein COW16_03260 [Sphingomonadales bacterium CG12_big_fil_rev_8_21_14_0_65_65_10]|nr:MAG: hypothetical protein COW16_03260 [Sphingomonadales bacterium CG12_big_fil_rev_8_21_14_0_65_65_10]